MLRVDALVDPPGRLQVGAPEAAQEPLSFIVVEPPEKTASPATSAIMAAPSTSARKRSRIFPK